MLSSCCGTLEVLELKQSPWYRHYRSTYHHKSRSGYMGPLRHFSALRHFHSNFNMIAFSDRHSLQFHDFFPQSIEKIILEEVKCVRQGQYEYAEMDDFWSDLKYFGPGAGVLPETERGAASILTWRHDSPYKLKTFGSYSYWRPMRYGITFGRFT